MANLFLKQLPFPKELRMTEQSLQNKKVEILLCFDEAQMKAGFGLVLNWFGEQIQKMIRSRERPSEVISVLVYQLILTIISVLLIFLLDKDYDKIFSSIGSIFLLNFVVVPVIVLVSQAYYRTTFKSLREFLVDAIARYDDLVDFHTWMKSLLNYSRQIGFSIIFGLTCGSFSTIVGNLLGFKSYGFVFYFFGLSVIGGFILYTTYLFIFFPLRISNYTFNIYSSDPGKATFTQQLASVLNGLVFLNAILGMLVVFLSIIYGFGIDLRIQAAFIFVLWLPITLFFVLNQFGLSKIIARAKTQKLTEIENEIRLMEITNKISDKETLEAINRMMDYHNRVQSTNNASLNFRTILNYLKSLFFPALGLIIDTLIKLLSGKP
jgi:hypothetical protein